jgi:hypothetical protein
MPSNINARRRIVLISVLDHQGTQSSDRSKRLGNDAVHVKVGPLAPSATLASGQVLIALARKRSALGLTRALPDRISRAWDVKVPFDEFDAMCLELGDTHGRAVVLYRQHPGEGVSL